MRRLLVTGGTGSIGKAVLDRIPKNITVILLTRNPEHYDERKNVKVEFFDYRNKNPFPINLWNATEVLHMAGATHEVNHKIYFSVNTHLTQRLVKLCETNKIERFTYISTQAVSEIGGAYSKSKLLAENIILNSKLNWTILRPSEVYGHGINSMIKKLCNLIHILPIIPIFGNGLYHLNPIHIDDLSSFINKVVTSNSNLCFKKIYVLCGPKPFQFIEFCKLYAAHIKKKRYFIRIPITVVRYVIGVLNIFGFRYLVPDQINRLIIDKCNYCSKALDDYGFKPRYFDRNQY